MPTAYIPSPLRHLTRGQTKVHTTGATVRELVEALERQYPGIRPQLLDETGSVRTFINVFVNGTEIRQLEGLATPLTEADEVAIVPAMAGGGRTSACVRALSIRGPTCEGEGHAA